MHYRGITPMITCAPQEHHEEHMCVFAPLVTTRRTALVRDYAFLGTPQALL